MKLNHIGIVVSSVEKETLFYQNLGFSASGVIVNETQKVKEVFVNQNDNTTIELLEPLCETSPVYNFLQKGGGVHHFCYEIDQDITDFLVKQKKEGAVVICKPINDVAFDRKIAFFYKYGKLIEVVESLGSKGQ